MIFVDRFSITFSSEIDPLAKSNIFQITGPATRCFHFQNETIVFGIVGAFAGQAEVGDKFTVVQSKDVSCPGTVRLKVENASVSAAHRGWRIYIPVKELRQIVDLCFYGGKYLAGLPKGFVLRGETGTNSSATIPSQTVSR